MEIPNLEQIQQARVRIAPYIRRTPYLRFDSLSTRLGKEIFVKCESLQRTGSFKIRGAANCILENLAQAKAKGVIAASAGNHAQGVAAMAKLLGIRATIVMPTLTPPIKVENTRAWGAEIELVGSVYDEAFEHAQALTQKHGFLFVHPFKDPLIIAGQGTIGLELLEEAEFKDIEAVIISVGGGGLAAGCAVALKAKRPELKIYGVSATNAPAAYRSFRKGKILEEAVRPTLAEGVATKRPDPYNLKILEEHLDGFFSVKEESIAQAMGLLTEQGKLVVEGAGALAVASLLENQIPEKRVAAILSGGNVDVMALTHVLERGLVTQGRLVRLVIHVTDRPGGLHSITEVLFHGGGNILQVFHSRTSAHHQFGEAEVEVDLETRSEKHTQEIIELLKKRGFRVERVA